MMRRWLALLLLLMTPVCAQAETALRMEQDEATGLCVFFAESAEGDPIGMALDMQIEARFAQEEAAKIAARGGQMLAQQGRLYQDGRIASMALLWDGELADGRDGSAAYGLTVDLATGFEIRLEELFAQPEAAFAAMEAIIERDILEEMNTYIEVADLLPVPRDCYCVDENGLTVYYADDAYRYFDGTRGSVTFYWYELAEYIGEDSPVYALSRPQEADAQALERLCAQGTLGAGTDAVLGDLLGTIADALADPDYTRDALVYPLERVRGWAVEIPKYAETDELETPVSAIRASRVSLCGLTTGKSTQADARALLGEPAVVQSYDEDAAIDALLDPGESLLYEVAGHVLQLHFGQDGALACVILRDALPESLY